MNRDAFFFELFGRPPTSNELERFNRMGSIMRLSLEDSMWYVILVNEFYDDRHAKRLIEIDRVADEAAKQALLKISETVADKAEQIAERKNKGFILRSWGLLLSFVVLFGAIVFNAGFVMGNGKYPFWLSNEQNALQRVAGWFLNVPAGWIFILGTAPIFFEISARNMREIRTNQRLGHTKANPQLLLKVCGSLMALLFVFLLVLLV